MVGSSIVISPVMVWRSSAFDSGAVWQEVLFGISACSPRLGVPLSLCDNIMNPDPGCFLKWYRESRMPAISCSPSGAPLITDCLKASRSSTRLLFGTFSTGGDREPFERASHRSFTVWAFSSTFSAVTKLFKRAMVRAVQPYESPIVGSAPSERRSLTIFDLKLRAALCRAVSPKSSFSFTSTP